MKKYYLFLLAIIIASTFSYSLVEIPHALAAADSGFVALAPIPGLTDNQTISGVSSGTFSVFFNNLYKYLIGLAAILAVIQIIWGGLEISTKDSVSRQSDGRSRIQSAIFGLVLVLMPVLVFNIINPSILNLEINMQALDTAYIPGDAGNGVVPIGGQCTSSDQCQSRYCDAGVTPNRCANTPDESGNQCEPGPNPPAALACPVSPIKFECVATPAPENKYVCQKVCLQPGYDPPAEFPDDCPATAPFAQFCPTGSPDLNECKLSPTLRMAVCFNLNTDPSCLLAEPKREADIIRDYVP